MKYTPRESSENINVTPVSPVREFFGLVFILAAIVVGIYLALGLLVDVVAARISPQTEAALTPLFSSLIEDDPKLAKQRERVQNIVDKLSHYLPRNEYTFKVHIKDDSQVNALAVPGGHVVVYKGLLDQIKSENELALVLGHELGHFIHRDQLRGLGRGIVFTFLVSALFGADSSLAQLTSNLLLTTQFKFSRDQERNADEVGLELVNAGFGHIGGATDFFERLHEKGESALFAMISTHPLSLERVQALRSQAVVKGFASGEKTPW